MNITQFTAVKGRIPARRRLNKLLNFPTYDVFYKEWKEYFDKIFVPSFVRSLKWRVILCESCPGNVANYMFSNLHLPINEVTDAYLWNIFAGVFSGYSSEGLTRRKALEMLAQKNILIMDMLPTHGISLKTEERRWFCMNGIQNFGFGFSIIHSPIYNIYHREYIYAVPPSLIDCDNDSRVNQDYEYTPPIAPVFMGGLNINIGQGHVPNKNALRRAIENGF